MVNSLAELKTHVAASAPTASGFLAWLEPFIGSILSNTKTTVGWNVILSTLAANASGGIDGEIRALIIAGPQIFPSSVTDQQLWDAGLDATMIAYSIFGHLPVSA